MILIVSGTIFPDRVFMPGVGKLFNESGQLTDGDLCRRLHLQAASFVEFTWKLNNRRHDPHQLIPAGAGRSQ